MRPVLHHPGSIRKLDVVQAIGGTQDLSAEHASEVALDNGLLLILVPHATTRKG